jgi:serine/threonine protein kinase
MSYCINPNCQSPKNLDRATVCTSCESNLLLKGRYRVFHTLGQSIACRTFLAVDEDQPAQPRCVIQQFCGPVPSVADGQKQLNRTFLGSAEVLDKLGQHPQIPKLLASFQVEGCQYLVQEYIPGRNLADRLSEKGVLKEIHIWYLLSELLPVLQFVHENQLIHRDIKPSNIIHRKSSQTSAAIAGKEHLHSWDEESGLVLVDFGAAIPANSGPLKTETVTGSAEYAAPEQIKGEAIKSSDIYSLGVTCIHLLTGMSPFDLFDIKADTWAWRHYLKVPVSARLGRILDKMVEREPSKRYRSTEAILTDMKYGPTPIDVIVSKPKLTLAAWGGAVVALISLVLGSRLPSTVPEALTSAQPVSSIPEIRFDPPPMQNFSGEAPPAVRTLAEQDKNPVWAVAVTPNGRAIVSGNNDGTIHLLHKRHGKVLKVLGGHLGPVWSVAVSPDGRTIASGGADGTIKLWNFYSGQLIRTLDADKDGVFSVVFSPDGQALASVGKDNTLKLWQVEGGAELETLKGIPGEVHSVAFSPYKDTLFTGNGDGTIQMWNWKTGAFQATLTGHVDAVSALAVSPDGKILGSGGWDNTVRVWDITTDRGSEPSGEVTFNGHTDRIQSLAFSPDGATLASGDLSGTIKLWGMDGGEQGTLKGHSTWVELAFNPQDKTLISGSFDDTIKVWRVSP